MKNKQFFINLFEKNNNDYSVLTQEDISSILNILKSRDTLSNICSCKKLSYQAILNFLIFLDSNKTEFNPISKNNKEILLEKIQNNMKYQSEYLSTLNLDMTLLDHLLFYVIENHLYFYSYIENLATEKEINTLYELLLKDENRFFFYLKTHIKKLKVENSIEYENLHHSQYKIYELPVSFLKINNDYHLFFESPYFIPNLKDKIKLEVITVKTLEIIDSLNKRKRLNSLNSIILEELNKTAYQQDSLELQNEMNKINFGNVFRAVKNILNDDYFNYIENDVKKDPTSQKYEDYFMLRNRIYFNYYKLILNKKKDIA